MTYLDSEKSTRSGTPSELFKFEGTYTSYYYTSGPEPITYGIDADTNPIVYQPVAIKRSDVSAGTQEDDGLDVTVEMPVSLALVQDYAFQASPPALNLTIYRYHSLLDVAIYWRGPVDNVQVENGVATIRSPSVLAKALSETAPSVYYQAPCNHALYDTRCKVLADLWSNDTLISAIADKTITVASIGTLDGKLIGGELVLASGERRMIVKQTGTVLTVNYPFSQISVGLTATVTAGCDHAYLGDCKTRFANQLNFGGFPFIPPENPFTDGIEPGTAIPDNTCLPYIPFFEGWYEDIIVNYPEGGYGGSVAPAWAIRWWPQVQPNGPGGKIVGKTAAGSALTDGAIDQSSGTGYENNTGVFPLLGQKLWEVIVQANDHLQIRLYFDRPAGGFDWFFQYDAGAMSPSPQPIRFYSARWDDTSATGSVLLYEGSVGNLWPSYFSFAG